MLEFESRGLLSDFAFLNKHPPISDKISHAHVYLQTVLNLTHELLGSFCVFVRSSLLNLGAHSEYG